MSLPRYFYTSDATRGDGKQYYTATPIHSADYRFYCTNLDGCGLFLVTPYERIQIVDTSKFMVTSLAQFKYKFRKLVKQ